ncbi:class I SAM-dependent methyltransferase [Candidatus Albibeggiatoa sp. nov. NOAA]|uniref:class I SAM-dependent methyltransferase n=1 Tax=Candidatus Albibeggiatoa sp. nov. NOAA TaxID=3162724 RepID=UPI0032F2F5A1|nr:class I SAM-dependent methyltransferase [Thiotrichaceae bacterium]
MGTCLAELYHWFATPLGERLLQSEARLMQQILPDLFGYHLLQVGNIGYGKLLESSRINHRCILCLRNPHFEDPYSILHASADNLPFASDSVDVVVLPHVLEFEEHPHQILREVERVLIAEGHVVIIGFNPVSLWGLWHRFISRRKQAPWCSQFLPVLRVKDWLALLEFEKVQQHTLFFAPPFYSHWVTMKRLDKFGSRWGKDFGAVYVLVARKRVATLTPIKPKWTAEPVMVSTPIGSRLEKHHE